MCVHAVKISDASDLSLRVLNAVIGGADAPCPRRVRYDVIAAQIGTTEYTVRYHIRKLVRTGYLRASSAGYEPTGKVLFLPAHGVGSAPTSIGEMSGAAREIGFEKRKTPVQAFEVGV